MGSGGDKGPSGIPPDRGVSAFERGADPEPMQARLEAIGEYAMTVVGAIVFGTGILATVVGRMLRLGAREERPKGSV